MMETNTGGMNMTFFHLQTVSVLEMPQPIPLIVAIFTISFLMIRRDLKNYHVANYGLGKTSLSR